ncbi:hypothetical protein SASPL_105526 [Salvia splendens]|uniref:Serine aminopeptidase S33 domain-containing protein n=1 Tax=Salvia splendens TaxID=180675 RepID=A0A8X9A8R6_SALSN|nr:hypothetical protein SASPL_105526 [Salvia splendens]
MPIKKEGCAARLVKAGYEVHGIDCEGHGKSSGQLGLVTSFDDHFTNISERKENRNKLRISMGGAMVLHLHRKMHAFWDGAILVAPMCKVRSNPYTYRGRPRLQTGYQLYAASMDLEQRLQEVSLSFIVLHGEEDKVTDPSVSKTLHETARATDKTIKLYPGMWHSLSYGELPENLDIVNWVDQTLSVRLEEQLK